MRGRGHPRPELTSTVEVFSVVVEREQGITWRPQTREMQKGEKPTRANFSSSFWHP